MILIYLVTVAIFLFLVISTILILKMLDKDKVRIIIAYDDKRLKTFKKKPNGNIVTVDGKTFTINDKDFTLIKNMPTYIFKNDNTQPINLYTGERSQYSPEQLTVAIENNVVKDIYNSTQKGGFGENGLVLILLFVIIGALGVIAYMGNDLIGNLVTKIDAIVEALKTIGLEV